MIIDANLTTLYRLIEINARLEKTPLKICQRLDDAAGNPLLLILQNESISFFAFSIQPTTCEILPMQRTASRASLTDSEVWGMLKAILKSNRVLILEEVEMTSTGCGLAARTKEEITSIFRDLCVKNTAGIVSAPRRRHRRPGPGDANLVIYVAILEEALNGDETISAICIRLSEHYARNRMIAPTTIFRNMYQIVTNLSERKPLGDLLKALEKRNWINYYRQGEQAKGKT